MSEQQVERQPSAPPAYSSVPTSENTTNIDLSRLYSLLNETQIYQQYQNRSERIGKAIGTCKRDKNYF